MTTKLMLDNIEFELISPNKLDTSNLTCKYPDINGNIWDYTFEFRRRHTNITELCESLIDTYRIVSRDFNINPLMDHIRLLFMIRSVLIPNNAMMLIDRTFCSNEELGICELQFIDLGYRFTRNDDKVFTGRTMPDLYSEIAKSVKPYSKWK